MNRLLKASALVIIGLCAAVSCRNNDVDRDNFLEYVKAFSGGALDSDAPVTILLAREPSPSCMENGVLPTENILKISPRIKGKVVWSASDRIEFIPDIDAATPGRTYKARLKLGKLFPDGKKGPNDFIFRFRTRQKRISGKLENLYLDGDQACAILHLDLSFASSAEDMLSGINAAYSVPDRAQEAKPKVEIEELNPKSFRLTVSQLERADNDRTLELSFKKIGNMGDRIKVDIPGKGEFRYLGILPSGTKASRIDLLFSDALAEPASGLVRVSGTGHYYIQKENNILRISYDRPTGDEIRIDIDPALKDRNGIKLGRACHESIPIGEEKPQLRLDSKGNILPDPDRLTLPFSAVGLRAVDVQVIKIYENNILGFLQDNAINGDAGLRRSGRMVWKGSVRLDPPENGDLRSWQNYSLDLRGLFRQENDCIYRVRLSFRKEYSVYGKSDEQLSAAPLLLPAPGMTEEEKVVWDQPYPYWWFDDADWERYNWEEVDDPLKDSYYMESWRFPSANLIYGKLALMAKYADGDRLWISASDIMDAKAVSGAEIKAYNYQLQIIGKGMSDNSGNATIKLDGRPFAVSVSKDGQKAYLRMGQGNANDLSRFDVGGSLLQDGLKAFIYGERGIWRPGDSLFVSMMVSDKAGALPEGHPATLELYNPLGQFHSRLTVGGGPDGLYCFPMATAENDPTGVWTARIKVGGSKFTKRLSIRSIRPNRLKINADFGQMLRSGKEYTANVSSSWLSGPAASGLQFKAAMTLRKAAEPWAKDFEGYSFSDPTGIYPDAESVLIDDILDQNGKLSIKRLCSEFHGSPGMMHADILCTVSEKGGEQSISMVSLPLSPYRAYAGLACADMLETDTENIFRVVSVDEQGRTLKGRKLEYNIYKLKWSWWWEAQSQGSAVYAEAKTSGNVAHGTLVTGSGNDSFSFRLDYPQWGRFLVCVTDVESGHTAGKIVTIDWPAYRGRADKSDPEAVTMTTFSSDKEEYHPGDLATIYIPACDGFALLSVENAAGVMARYRIKTAADADTPFRIKIKEDMAPNFYVHLSLMHPYRGSKGDTPLRLYGIKPLRVSSEDSRLNPVLEMPEVLSPGEEFTLKVREAGGRKMSYTLALVDEGLLDITSFKTPDPWSEMNRKEALGVSTWDNFDQFMFAGRNVLAMAGSIGGDEQVLPEAISDKRFNPVVRFIGPCRLGGKVASHKITLPMYVGSVRAMLVASDGRAYGSTSKNARVVSPLMMVPTAPATVSEGDEFDVAVNVFASEDALGEVKVKIGAGGGLRVSGQQLKTLSFSRASDKLVRFRLKALESGGSSIKIEAISGNKSFATDLKIEVKAAKHVIRTGKSAVLKKGESISDEADAGVLGIASFPCPPYGELERWFLAYPYSCSEQLASKGCALLMLAEKTGTASVENIVKDICKELYARQLSDGSFSCWPGSYVSDPWVSPMVLLFLEMASSKGYDVDYSSLSNARRAQTRLCNEFRSTASAEEKIIQAFRLYVLARSGWAQNGAMNRLKENGELPAQAVWLLSSAYSLCGKSNVAATMSTEGPEAGNGKLYGSALRDLAMELEARARLGSLEEALPLAARLSDALTSGRYSTQDAVFALSAVSAMPVQSGFSVKIDGRLLNGNIPFYEENFKGKKEVVNMGDAPVYVTLVKNGIQAGGTVSQGQDVTPAQASGLELGYAWFDENGEALDPSVLKQGREFISRITVRNTDLHREVENVALLQSLPAGWEPRKDETLGLTASADSFIYNDLRDDGSLWVFSLDRGGEKTFTLHLRAAYCGEFRLPAAQAEAMYSPEIYANTQSGKVKVRE